MEQKCSILNVLKVFFEEPTEVHFIRGISKRINLAPTSVRNNIKELERKGLVLKQKSKPFEGYVANLENSQFLFYKKVYNLYSLEKLKNYLEKNYAPKLAVIFGSYALGEDIENSDIDLFILTKGKSKINVKKFEKELKREINLLVLNNLNKLDEPLKKKIYNGFVICGGFDG